MPIKQPFSSFVGRTSKILFFLFLASSSLEATTFRVAVIVGNNRGAEEHIPLRYAESDAKNVYETLTTLGEFRAENTFLLVGKNVETLRKTLERAQYLIRNLRRDPFNDILFFFYYSGHAEGGFLELGDGKIAGSELKKIIQGSPASVKIGLIDSCYSGEFTRPKGGDLPVPVRIETMEMPKGEVFISSSTEMEASQESSTLQGSFFTHFFISGLHGDADFNRDGRVTLTEVYPYAAQRTVLRSSRLWGKQQHPTYDFRLSGGGEIVLSDLTRGSPLLVLSASDDGVFTVYDWGSRRLALEVEKKAGVEKRIALPEKLLLVRQTQGKTIREKELKASPHGIYLIDWKGASVRPFQPSSRTLGSYQTTGQKRLLGEGELIPLRLMETVNSKFAHIGDKVSFETTEDVWIDHVLVIPAGAPATGEIRHLKEKRGLSNGVIVCEVGYVQAIDGRKVPLNSMISRVAHRRSLSNLEDLREGDDSTTAMDLLSGVTATLFFPFYPFLQGRHAILEEGTLFEAYVARDTWISGIDNPELLN